MAFPISPDLAPPPALLPPRPQRAHASHHESNHAAAATAAETARARPYTSSAAMRRVVTTAALDELLGSLERAVVSGKGKKLKKAVEKLPAALARVRRSPQQGKSDAVEGDDAGPERADESAHGPQGASARAREGALQSLRFELPLPQGGEASVEVERRERPGGGEAHGVALELQVAELGSVGIRLLADEHTVVCSVATADPEVRQHLAEGLTELREAVGRAAGRPASVSLEQRAASEPRAPERAPEERFEAYG